MTSYITITDAETDPEAPLTSELAKKWRDNPIAIAEGDASVPNEVRIRLGALQQLTAGTTIVSRDDTLQTTSSDTFVTVQAWGFLQSGTVRVTLQHSSSTGSTVEARIVRTRNNVGTTLQTWSTTSTSLVTRTLDVSIQPGDIVSIQHRRTSTTLSYVSEIDTMRLQTGGEVWWPQASGVAWE